MYISIIVLASIKISFRILLWVMEYILARLALFPVAEHILLGRDLPGEFTVSPKLS